MPVRTTVVFLFMILRKGKSNIETPLLSAKKGWKNYRQQEEISFIKWTPSWKKDTKSIRGKIFLPKISQNITTYEKIDNGWISRL